MKRMLGIMIGALIVFAMVGCSGSADGEKEVAPEVSVEEVMDGIKGQVVQDVKDAGFDEGQSDEELIQSYMQLDLVNGDKEDPFIQMLLERTELDTGLLEEGYLFAPIFKTKSDEIIVLKAKSNEDAEVLKASLQKELDAQIQTWSQYLPDQYAHVEKNVLKTKGKYVVYITYSNVDAVEKVFDEKVK